jgi:hypothetical protein
MLVRENRLAIYAGELSYICVVNVTDFSSRGEPRARTAMVMLSLDLRGRPRQLRAQQALELLLDVGRVFCSTSGSS